MNDFQIFLNINIKYKQIDFIITSMNKSEIKISDESHKVEWIPLDRVLDYNSEESIKRMVEKTYLLKNNN